MIEGTNLFCRDGKATFFHLAADAHQGITRFYFISGYDLGRAGFRGGFTRIGLAEKAAQFFRRGCKIQGLAILE